MAITTRRGKGAQLTWDEVDDNWDVLQGLNNTLFSSPDRSTLLLEGETTAWDDLLMPLQSGRQGVLNKPDFDAADGVYLFPQNDPSEIIYFNVQLPHRWKVGSVVYPHVHWHQAANQAPVWKVDYRWADIGGAVGAWQTYTMDVLVKTYTSGTMHQISNNSTGISGAGKTISSILQCKLYRDDNVYTGDAGAVSFDVHIEVDSFGSDTEFSK